MAKVYAHETHYYRHSVAGKTPVDYIFPKGEVRVVPEDVAARVCGAHPQKLQRLGEYEAPPGEGGTQGEPEAYETAVVEEPPTDRMMHPQRKSRRRSPVGSRKA